jgi:hypothetical protein
MNSSSTSSTIETLLLIPNSSNCISSDGDDHSQVGHALASSSIIMSSPILSSSTPTAPNLQNSTQELNLTISSSSSMNSHHPPQSLSKFNNGNEDNTDCSSIVVSSQENNLSSTPISSTSSSASSLELTSSSTTSFKKFKIPPERQQQPTVWSHVNSEEIFETCTTSKHELPLKVGDDEPELSQLKLLTEKLQMMKKVSFHNVGEDDNVDFDWDEKQSWCITVPSGNN